MIVSKLFLLVYINTRASRYHAIARTDQEAFHQKAKIDIGLQAALHLTDLG